MLEQNTTKKRKIDKNITKLDADKDNNEVYKVEAIQDSTVYAR